jgi:hypothetical protein
VRVGGLPSEAKFSCTLQLREQISLLPLYVLCDSNCRVHIENFGELMERDVDSDSDETITNNNTEHFTKEQIPELISPVLRIRDVFLDSGSRIRLFSILGPGSEIFPSRIHIKEFKSFIQKNGF